MCNNFPDIQKREDKFENMHTVLWNLIVLMTLAAWRDTRGLAPILMSRGMSTEYDLTVKLGRNSDSNPTVAQEMDTWRNDFKVLKST
jgi:hypothetical protein